MAETRLKFYRVASDVTPKGRTIPLPSPQFVIAFVLVAVLLFAVNFPGIGVIAFLGAILASGAFEWRSVLANPNIIPIGFLLAFGMVSATWSVYPTVTLYYGVQIILTVFGSMIIASSSRPYDSLMGVGICLTIHSLLNHVFGHYTAWEGGKVVFIGLMGAKNFYGGISGLTALTCLGLIYAAIARNQKWVIAIALIGLASGALGCLRSLATGFTLSAFACCAFIMYMNVYGVLSNRLRVAIGIFTVYILVCVGAFGLFLKNDLTDIFLKLTHKDAGLTGRTEIWDVVRDCYNHHFWLGMGQSAFWVPGNPYAERLWREYGMAAKMGLPVHNTYLEIGVSLGIVGVVVNAIVAAWLVIRQLRVMLISPTTTQITWTAISFFFLFLLGVESFNLSPLNYYTQFFVLALTFAPSDPKRKEMFTSPLVRREFNQARAA